VPENEIKPGEDGNLYWSRRTFRRARIDDFSDPPAQDPDTFEALDNVLVGAENAIQRRWGYTLQTNPSSNSRRLFETHFANGRNRFVGTAADGSGASGPDNKVVAYNENGVEVTLPHTIFTPSNIAHHPHATTSRNYVFFTDSANDDLVKWDTEDDPTGSTASPETGISIPSVSKWGIDAPDTAPTAAATGEGSGSIYLVEGRAYAVLFRNSLSGHTSSPSPFTERFGVTSDPEDSATGVTVELTDIPISTDPQVDQRIIVATTDGGALDTLYEVGRIDDNTTTDFTDDVSETALADQNIWAELDADGNEVGVFNNTPPANILTDGGDTTICQVHRGRVYIIQGHFLFWSKTLAEVTTSTGNVTARWEECFPASNQVSLSSTGAELGTGLKSDDIDLYIGTNRNIYRTSGDAIGFVQPRAQFHEVGLLNQECWQIVYHEGRASGMIWMTPDKRIVISDFTNYEEIGNSFSGYSSIQAALNALDDTTIADTVRSCFIADGPHEFYMLAVGDPSLDIWVYNVRTNAWMRWASSYAEDSIYAMSFMYDSINRRPLGIFSSTALRIYRWNPDSVYDRDSAGETPQLCAPSFRTVWIGDPISVHLLNSVEIQTAEPSATVTIEGARNFAEFESPVSIGTFSFTSNAFGALRSSLATARTRHRFYRFTFGGFDDSEEVDLLRYLNIEAVPFANI